MKKLLIVDDQRGIRELLQVTLEFNDCQILMAENGRQALAVARAEHPDVILLDIMLPGSEVDGLEACRLLKTDPTTANITIFLLSAKGQKRDIQAGMEAGADDYFTKPFSPMALIKRVDEIVGQNGSGSPIQTKFRRGIS